MDTGTATHAHDRRCRSLAAAGEEAVPALLEALLHWARDAGASDIHIDPIDGELRLRLRIDGAAHEVARLPGGLAANLAARCKVLAGLLSYRCDRPQEGGVQRAASPIGRELRISTFPTVQGERIAIRLFAAAQSAPALAELGLPADTHAILLRCLQAGSGLVLLAGPCGAGKTTTLYSCLQHIAGAETGRVVLSVEDPVEMRLPAITQTQIRPAIGLDFPTALRSLLRQDPDVLMIGEIRDAETAAVALQAAGTGHLVLSSLHCGSAAAVPDRLLDMGLPAYAIAGALRLVCCQRLLRRLCTDCRRQDHEAWEAIGCDSCHQTGYDGRVLVAEHCLVEEDLRRAIARGQPRGPARAAVARPIAAGIAELLRDGITSPAEAARQEDQA